jgi:ADP-ribose pyrophosphatase YjhB (NUDIX family)
MVKPWRILQSWSVHRDRWIDVRADRCETPSGREIGPYYVLTYPDWVHVVALTDDGDIVLVEQYRHAATAVTLELPGGMMDAADAGPVQTAARELQEETGYAAERLTLVSSLFTNPATHTNRMHTVLATGCRLTSATSLEAGEEGLQVRRMKLDAVVSGLENGILPHQMQVGCLLLALRMAGKTDA